MKMSETRLLPAPKQLVWEKLNDVDVLRRCIPGCQKLEQVDENFLKAQVGLKIGPINAKFDSEVRLSDVDPPNAYRISGSGKGGVAGNATGGANVVLSDADGDATELAYDVDARVTGKIAQLGSRLIEATARSLASKFFDNLEAEFTSPNDEDSGAQQSDSGTVNESRSGNNGVPQVLWFVGGAVLVAIAYYAFS